MSFVYLSDVTHNLFQRTIFNFAHTPWNTFIFLPFKPCEISTPRRFFLFLETKSMTLFIKGVLFCIPLMPLFQSSSSFSYFFSFFLSFNQRPSVPFDVREKRCSPWDKCDNGSAFIFFLLLLLSNVLKQSRASFSLPSKTDRRWWSHSLKWKITIVACMAGGSRSIAKGCKIKIRFRGLKFVKY